MSEDICVLCGQYPPMEGGILCCWCLEAQDAAGEEEYNLLYCSNCGGVEWDYSGEAYDDDIHLGSVMICRDCGHHQLDDSFVGDDYLDW